MPGTEIQEGIDAFSQVIYVDLITPVQLGFDPADLHFDRQWGLKNTGQVFDAFQCIPNIDINAPEAWDIQLGSTVKIGISDTGIDKGHEDLAQAVDPFLFFGPNGGQGECPTGPHGSAVGGIAGAVGNNLKGISGVATPQGGAILVPMRITSAQSGPCNVDAAEGLNALAWATTPPVFPQISIVNHSWGRIDLEGEDYWSSFRDGFRNAFLKCLFLTAISGNFDCAVPCPFHPADFVDYCFTVAAVVCDGSHPAGYRISDKIDAAAPGGNPGYIVTCYGESSQYEYYGIDTDYFGGTSASAPVVSGVAALLLAEEPSLTNEDVAEVLSRTATDLDPPGKDGFFGYGLVRADTALTLISSPNQVVHGVTTTSRIDSIDTQTLQFMNVPCISNNPETWETFTIDIYEMVAYAPFPQNPSPTEPPVEVWTRGRQSTGWREITLADYPSPGGYDAMLFGNWAEVVEGTVAAQGCSLRAYTCRFFENGQYKGWYPVNGVTSVTTCTGAPSFAALGYTYVVSIATPIAGGSPELSLLGGPNPFNPSATFELRLPEPEDFHAVIFDVGGRQIRVLASGEAGPGAVHLTWDGRDSEGRSVSSGAYLLRVQAGGVSMSRKLHLVR